MGKYKSYYKAIDTIIDFLDKELVGPVSKDEVLENEAPLNVYAMGILWPRRTGETQDAEICEDDDTVEDFKQIENASIRDANKYKPSAVAISVIVPFCTKSVDVSFSYASYNHTEKTSEDGRANHYYSRTAREEFAEIDIPLHCPGVSNAIDLQNPAIDIQCHYRKKVPQGKMITISISNTGVASQKIVAQNEAALFQCKLRIDCREGFVPLNSDTNKRADEEGSINDMLYRHVHNYAYGHGCAIKSIGRTNVHSVESDFLPHQKVRLMMPTSINNNDILSMVYWKNTDRKSATKALYKFIAEYEEWYKKLQNTTNSLKAYRWAADINLKNIDICITRLKNGVKYLENDDDAWQAFLLMNEAMLLQMRKTKRCNEDEVKWYPFQLAYIIQILPDIVDEKSEFRNTVDLLWFPTGGGKTEAYLGVCAFVIFLRRLTQKNTIQDGVTIFMRYTLRLLTLQQFERATVLICACEFLRRKYGISGGEINIGLWIGSGMTPNHLKGEGSAEEKLNKIFNNGEDSVKEGNPVQITKCPWCGETIDPNDYYIGTHMQIRCPSNKCDFHDHLPIYLVDDDIYYMRPTLVLSTVDKFARLVWEGGAKNLFCPEDVDAPELIVQDELHLISGPLGSLAGAYELAVDMLCSHKGKKPKIISSTATVCHAKKQIKELYDRDMFQFPPNGLDARDSFFAKEATDDERPTRTYVGLCETGGSLADLIVRVYANLIFIREYFKKKKMPEKVIDQYFTIVGYFNAIKDLGASANILNDRLSAYLKMLINHKFKRYADDVGMSTQDFTKYRTADELTSRKSSRDIKNILERLSKRYTDDRCYSYILASNMLSVGIDIDRFGVMTMYNQPKTNSEYIQATSRVGRSNPGLVIGMYNNQRARDKSHYEQFTYYHKTFYKYVEATSVTPFSSRSIEKTLQGVFIGLVRHIIPGMNDNGAAAQYYDELEGVDEIKKAMLKRIHDIYPASDEYAAEWIDDVSKEWQALAEEYGDDFMYYSKDKPCLLNSEDNNEVTERFPLILNSLRNVEKVSNIYIKSRFEE
ncbi:MAG: helicase-related protein [Candidatus Ornithomonoglobus sp.]